MRQSDAYLEQFREKDFKRLMDGVSDLRMKLPLNERVDKIQELKDILDNQLSAITNKYDEGTNLSNPAFKGSSYSTLLRELIYSLVSDKNLTSYEVHDLYIKLRAEVIDNTCKEYKESNRHLLTESEYADCIKYLMGKGYNIPSKYILSDNYSYRCSINNIQVGDSVKVIRTGEVGKVIKFCSYTNSSYKTVQIEIENSINGRRIKSYNPSSLTKIVD